MLTETQIKDICREITIGICMDIKTQQIFGPTLTSVVEMNKVYSERADITTKKVLEIFSTEDKEQILVRLLQVTAFNLFTTSVNKKMQEMSSEQRN